MKQLIKSLENFLGNENVFIMGEDIYLNCSIRYEYKDYIYVFKELTKTLPSIFNKIYFNHHGYKCYDEDGNSDYMELIHVANIKILTKDDVIKLRADLNNKTISICEKCKLPFIIDNKSKCTDILCINCSAIICMSSYLFQK